jgi:cytosine/adenosine deaminase-related metal-dependent hydrolase
MGYRKFKADKIFDGEEMRNHEWVLVTKEDGTIEEIIRTEDAGDQFENISGIISPGLVNCHCHLELSHLKDVIPPHTGLINFLKSVVQKRGFPAHVIQEAIENADREMFENGIVAVGDISNQVDAIQTKSKSKTRWHTFVEVLSPTDEQAEANIQQYKEVLASHRQHLPLPHRSVLTAHAPYTVSPKTFALINDATASEIISIHNQEHPAEDELYKTGGGEFMDLLHMFGFTSSPFPTTGKSSLQSYLPHFNRSQKIFLIHNTFIGKEDIQFAKDYAQQYGVALVFCVCPNANLYIENRLPPVEELVNANCFIVLGTDSYSSNWQLSIAKEMHTLLSSPYFEKMQREKAQEILLKWATKNGAEALGWSDEFGSFRKGTRPGIVLLANDFSSSKRIL